MKKFYKIEDELIARKLKKPIKKIRDEMFELSQNQEKKKMLIVFLNKQYVCYHQDTIKAFKEVYNEGYSEKEMLDEFVEIINTYDPDVISGFNINNFDLPYILDRMRSEGVKPIFGRCRQKQVNHKKFMNRTRINITGRVIVDSFELVKKDAMLKEACHRNIRQALLAKFGDSLGLADVA